MSCTGNVCAPVRIHGDAIASRAIAFLFVCATVMAMPLTEPSESIMASEPSAELSVREIYERARRWHDSIKSIHVEYNSTQREITRQPSFVMTPGTWHVVFDMKGERRKLQRTLVRLLRPELSGPPKEIYLFDGARSADVAFDVGPPGSPPVMKTVTIADGKPPRAQADTDNYCTAVLNIPLSDIERADYDKIYWYPHCMRDPSIKGLFCRVLQKQEQVDGAWCHVVEFPDSFKLWIDTKLNCACRKREQYHRDKNRLRLLNRAIMSDFVEAAPGMWLPKHFHEQIFFFLPTRPDLDGKVWVDTDIRVEQLEINSVDDNAFKLRIASGTVVFDRTHNRLFRLPADTDDLVREIAARAKRLVKPSVGAWRQCGILATSALIVALITMLLMRRTRRSHASDCAP